MTRLEYEEKIEEILDEALNNLSPDAFRRLIDDLLFRLEDYEET